MSSELKIYRNIAFIRRLSIRQILRLDPNTAITFLYCNISSSCVTCTVSDTCVNNRHSDTIPHFNSLKQRNKMLRDIRSSTLDPLDISGYNYNLAAYFYHNI